MKREQVGTRCNAWLVAIMIMSSSSVSQATGLASNSSVQAPVEEQEPAGAPPVGKIGSIRIQSSAQKIVEEDAIKNSLAHPPGAIQPPANGGKPSKPKKPVVFGKTSDKNEVRPVRGGAEMNSYDSLGGSEEKPSAAKGKAAKKEDSFD